MAYSFLDKMDSGGCRVIKKSSINVSLRATSEMNIFESFQDYLNRILLEKKTQLDADSYAIQIQDNDYKSDEFGSKLDLNTIHAYTGSGYKVNDKIRSDIFDEPDEMFANNLRISLDNLKKSPIKELYRGIRTKLDLNIGDVLSFEGFTSTSKDINKVKPFSSGVNFTLFLISSHKNGKDVESFSRWPIEKEVLFNTDTKWEVINKLKDSKNGYEIKQI